MPDDGDLTLVVGGQAFTGWTDIRVTRGMERTPADFDIAATEEYGGALSEVVVQPGQPCQVLIGGDVVVTGYVNRYAPSISKRTHMVRISGRGKCQDMTDCSAYLRGIKNQMLAASTAKVAAALAAVFDISTVVLSGDGQVVPQFNVILTETAWDVVERVARHSQMLAYENAAGELVLAKVGGDRMASGFQQGRNVESASVVFSDDGRFSLYEVVYMPVEILSDVERALQSNITANSRVSIGDITIGAAEPNTGRRFRPKVIIAEQGFYGDELARQRAEWERARRIGRSQSVRLVTDSWRDEAGRLWEPNTFVPLDLPALRLPDKEWVISEVTYTRGREGTHAELILMPEQAFTPEPILLQAYDAALAADLARGGVGLPPGGVVP